MTFEEAMDHALSLSGVARSTSYGQPAAKANHRAFLNVGHEPDTSFVLQLDPGLIEWLMDTYPATFWKTTHYQSHPAVLVRYDSVEEALVREMIESACARAKTLKPPRARRAK